MAVFVERTLTARKGTQRKQLRLRVHAPEAHGDHWTCRYELRVAGTRLRPSAGAAGIGGEDSWQALALAMKTAAYSLVQFERTTGARIDALDWLHVIDHLVDMPVPDAMRPRVAEIERELAAAQRAYRERHDHDHDHDHDHVRRARKRPAAGRRRRPSGR